MGSATHAAEMADSKDPLASQRRKEAGVPAIRMTKNSHLAVALAAAFIAILVIFQLVSSIGLPRPDVWHWVKDTTGAVQEYGETIGQANVLAEVEEARRQTEGTTYLLGVGKADITGPVVELNLMGYANASQVGSGLRQRLYSRAFIIGSPDEPSERFIYMVLDTQSGDTAIRNGILAGIQSLGSNYTMYGQSNVAVVGTHSHAGPGAWLNYLLPQITSLGFDKQSYQAIVDGALLSIQRAHESLTTGTLSVGTTTIEDANINRSLYAYLANPESERQKYSADVDKTLTLIRFRRSSDGKDIGVLTWFAVHGTSLLGNQTLVAGDNKGVAAHLFETQMTDSSTAADGFVAGFSQANVGDTTPNINGAWCEDGSNAPCRFNDSTCGGTSQACHGRGPFFGLNDGGAKSCFEIGRRQYAGALDLYNSMVSGTFTPISGTAVRSLHRFVDFSNYTFTLPNGTAVRTCSAALGNSFAAGTSDGPGAFDFTQGDSGNPDNPFWNAVGGLLHTPSAEQKACQSPKPILLDVGATTVPYAWAPNIVDIQLFRVGQLVIIVSPGEATTMSGRRWREAVAVAAPDALELDTDPIVLLGAPGNSYTHYIATPEEYGVQRYEGASTLYGPWTLPAYINLTLTYLPWLADDPPTTSLDPGPSPPDNRNASLSFITGVVYDGTPVGTSFGDVLTGPQSNYTAGETAQATFQAANPRNGLRLEGSYVLVQRRSDDDSTSWVTVADDADWSVWFEWRRTSTLLGWSEVDVYWEVGEDVKGGVYRLGYRGDWKAAVTGTITGFEGWTEGFEVV